MARNEAVRKIHIGRSVTGAAGQSQSRAVPRKTITQNGSIGFADRIDDDGGCRGVGFIKTITIDQQEQRHAGRALGVRSLGDFHCIGECIAVSVDIVRISAQRDFLTVGQGVAIGISQQRVGVVGVDLDPVIQAVAVGIHLLRVRSNLEFLQVGQSIAVAIKGGIGGIGGTQDSRTLSLVIVRDAVIISVGQSSIRSGCPARGQFIASQRRVIDPKLIKRRRGIAVSCPVRATQPVVDVVQVREHERRGGISRQQLPVAPIVDHAAAGSVRFDGDRIMK